MPTKQTNPPLLEKPLISIIIPYYNVPVELLLSAIESVQALSLPATSREIIVVDDGSEESPLNALQKYGAEVIYLRQHNQGLSAARNAGIQMAQGQYIQFLDSDDQLIPATFEHCLDLMRFNQPDMVMFDFSDSSEVSIDYKDQAQTSGCELMRQQNIHGSACGYLFRRDVLGELRFTPGIYHEDEEFTPQLILRCEKIVTTDAKAYLYRQRQGSITHMRDAAESSRRLNDLHDVILRLSTLIDSLPADAKPAMSRRVAQLSMDYLYNTILLTRSDKELECRISTLESEGLFPLPDRDYTRKYTWFRRLSNSRVGRAMLLRAIPLLNKER